MEDGGQSRQQPSTGQRGAGFRVIEGGRRSNEWWLLEMIVSPHRYSVEECEALQAQLAPRGRKRIRLAGGTETSKVLLGGRGPASDSEQ